MNNFELNLDTIMVNNPFLTVVLGEFNAKLNLWYSDDITTYEGLKIDGVIFAFGLQQIGKDSMHIIVYCLSCRNLIFTSQPNVVKESGVHSSLQANYHHHITFAKFNFILPVSCMYTDKQINCQGLLVFKTT